MEGNTLMTNGEWIIIALATPVSLSMAFSFIISGLAQYKIATNSKITTSFIQENK